MADVFLSYKREENNEARALSSAFERAGFSVWWDDRLHPHEAWDETIEREINEAKAVVVLWSPLATKSDWVRTEAHFASNRKVMVPILLKRCTIPLAFSLIQAIDLSDWDRDESDRKWRKCLTWVRDLVESAGRRALVGSALERGPERETFGALEQTGEPIVQGLQVGPGTPAGIVFADAPGLPAMRVLPAGRFLMGSSLEEKERRETEGPQHGVDIAAPFALGVYPVTFEEWDAIAADRIEHAPSDFGKGRGRRPVVDISWRDAMTFAQALSAVTGARYRLPSEAEWEYACRGGGLGIYPSGASLSPELALYDGSEGVAPVGRHAANGFGLFDMAGNAREWCADLWRNNYHGAPADGSAWVAGDGSMRAVRGGCYADPAALLRCAARARAGADERSPMIGLRLARDL